MQVVPITATDFDRVFEIWSSTLGQKWPLSKKILLQSLDLLHAAENRLNLGICHHDELIGFVVAEIIDSDKAALVVLAVDPLQQRKGFGSALLKNLIESLKSKGQKTLSLGAGASKLLWHGVPVSLGNATKFFDTQGFIFDETSYDLTQDITKFVLPKTSDSNGHNNEFKIAFLTDETAGSFLAVQYKYFPEWHAYFAAAVHKKDYANILTASRDGTILGGVLLSLAPRCPGGHWAEILKKPVGAFGILGVIPEEREKGIGMALAVQATKELSNRGVTTCFVHWTWLRDWYGKIGYTVWEEYKMGKLHWS